MQADSHGALEIFRRPHSHDRAHPRRESGTSGVAEGREEEQGREEQGWGEAQGREQEVWLRGDVQLRWWEGLQKE
jgi:hypothetical protein